MSEFVLYNPTVERRSGHDALARRHDTLKGSTVGLLWNSKPNADVFLATIKGVLAARYPSLRFIERSKPTASRPMAPEVFEDLKACDVVINAFGD
jgi:hypothetical protein